VIVKDGQLCFTTHHDKELEVGFGEESASIYLESISQPHPRVFETPVDRADREVVIEISAESQMGVGAAVLNH